MNFEPLGLGDACLVDAEAHEDARGSFQRLFCAREFTAHGLDGAVAQLSVSRTRRRGTLRGMHWQAPPHAEVKLVRCLRGRVYDAIVDLRRDSPSYLSWRAVELSADGAALYVPKGFAHGFLTLEDDCELLYQIGTFYAPEAARGARWNDPAFAIEWPFAPITLSPRDRDWPDFRP